MLLRVEGLTVAYNRLEVVHGAGLEVGEGEIVGLVGPNAAGKTTTLMTIAGALSPRAGRVLVDGEDLAGRSPEEMVGKGVSLVPEGRRILGSLTVDENLQLGAVGRRQSPEIRADAEALYERFPALAQYRDTRAGHLSGGEQQQLAIARALMARPRLLMVDEASLGLSPIAVDSVFDVLAGLKGEGRGVLVVEHDVERVLSVADRVYVLIEGRSDHLGESSGIDPAHLEALYLGVRDDESKAAASAWT